jgi:hypothetical protein
MKTLATITVLLQFIASIIGNLFLIGFFTGCIVIGIQWLRGKFNLEVGPSKKSNVTVSAAPAQA